MSSPAQIGQMPQIGQMQTPLQQGQDPVEPVYNYTYGEASSKNMTQVMKSPAEQAAIDAALAKGPPQGYLDNIASEELRLSSLFGSASDKGALIGSRPEPVYNYTYDDAVSRQMQRDVKSPAEEAAIMAAINAGPSAESQFGPQRPQLLPDFRGSLIDSANLKDATGMPDTRGPNVPGNRPPTSDGPIDPFARPTPGMLGPTTEVNPTAEPPTSPQPDVTKPPMPTGGLAGLTQLPMFQDFATKLEAEHPEASQLFSQMFMGSSQRPMPYQNPFMGMGLGSFHPMMGMGMGGFNPMMGGYNPMMGGMGMGGYSPFMGMNPFMGGGFNPMMGMGGGGLGSFYPQPSTYGPPQSMPSMGGYPTPPQSSPFGGAMRGYYA